MAKKDLPLRHSAGGVLIRNDEILFCHPTGADWHHWRMPKGQCDTDDLSYSATALREVLEETGFRCKILSEIKASPTKKAYYYSKDGKTKTPCMKQMHFFLMEPIEKVQEPDWEHDKFVWVPFEKADLYIFNWEKEVIKEAIDEWEDLHMRVAIP